MAFTSDQVSVGTTATLISATAGVDSDCLIKLGSAAGADVYLGGPGVTTSNGFPLSAGETIPTADLRYDDLYGIVASGTETVYVLARD